MTLKRIELSGFKSFAKKTVLEFNTPVTAVVGPNGSGKSNVVEAIRFVLGEQSMKSLRGKAGSDLIFKGSKNLSALQRASVTIVFDNSKKIFNFSSDDHPDMSYDEVSIGREVYSDGVNKYRVNGSEVRLKDVLDLLASVHIGSSGHHIISQGEADRLLSSSSKDRRGMIEDALGLKVYQYKIRESERKLEKTTNNTKEVQAVRREIAPHIAFLKKQVEKIEKTQILRDELAGLYRHYFGVAGRYSELEGGRLDRIRREHTEKLLKLNAELSEFEKNANSRTDAIDPELARLEKERALFRPLFDEFTRKLGRIEGTLEALEAKNMRQESSAEEHNDVSVPLSQFRAVTNEVGDIISSAVDTNDVHQMTRALLLVREKLSGFLGSFEGVKAVPKPRADDRDAEERETLAQTKRQLADDLAQLESRAASVEGAIVARKAALSTEEARLREMERGYYERKTTRAQLDAQTSVISLEVEALAVFTASAMEARKEAETIVGIGLLQPITDMSGEDNIHTLRVSADDLHKKIERIKIKLEDSGAAGGAEVVKEHEEAVARDLFLSRELDDLVKSGNELRLFIRELKDKLDTEFKTGIEKINKQFQEFFATMFGGGSAFLAVVVEHKRASKGGDEDDEEEKDEQGELEFERGIEINVNLPHKKVRDLHMLSGGERSLTSIALLFAMTQVNPPPFLVLDETDAALDEANSRKYGSMIETLSSATQLVVVTHNRETMSRAQVLYGVTIGADGGSKLLSIKFDEAVQIAK